MSEMYWFDIMYLDKKDNRYKFRFSQIKDDESRKSYLIHMEKFKDCENLGTTDIVLTWAWLRVHGQEIERLRNLKRIDDFPVIRSFFLDYFHKVKIDKIEKEIVFSSEGKFEDRIFINEQQKLDFKRDPMIVAEQNRFAREIILRELYRIQTNQTECASDELISFCNYDEKTLKNAINCLIDKKLIEEVQQGSRIRLTYSGYAFVEHNFYGYFQNKIFLIAACNEDIYEMIDKVYKPAVENEEIGCELVFQERSEPKGSLHDEIWENIERCKLTICDLTGSRPNCLIEYGYALAKDKRIILCIEESEGKNVEGSLKVPFDTLTQKFSFWKSEWLAENNEKELNKFKEEIKERVRMKINIINEKSEI
ncbi:MAG: hypothetical protein H8E87_05035 [FCB group bacterium]|nr:hypothetical protein [FCB group bacterium]